MGLLSTNLESLKSKTTKNSVQFIGLVTVSIAALLSICSPAFAADYSGQITQLKNQNSDNQSSLNNLKTAALPLQDKIANLEATINGLTSLINTNEQERQNLNGSIAALESQISDQRQILKDSVRQMYIEGDMSTLEIMASSKNLSDYVDKEQYTLSAQTKVKTGMDKINTMEDSQKKQRKQVTQLLSDSKKMQDSISAQKDQVNQLLASNEAQQSNVSQTISSNNAQISDLERKQAAENAQLLASQSASSSNAPVSQTATSANILAVDGTQYPWASAPWPNDIPDSWGMDERQCVSYTAWAVAASGRHMPYWGGSGNANQWPGDARAAGIPVDSNPRPGDVAISMSGTYGHAMYVDSINSDGSLNISQYNANWDGVYSTKTIYPGSLLFIHF